MEALDRARAKITLCFINILGPPLKKEMSHGSARLRWTRLSLPLKVRRARFSPPVLISDYTNLRCAHLYASRVSNYCNLTRAHLCSSQIIISYLNFL
jgi:hypothetical protein